MTHAAKQHLRTIDAHFHLSMYAEDERHAVLEHAFEQGVEAVIAVSMDLASSKLTRELANEYSGRLIPAYGFHPEQLLPATEELDLLFDWIRQRYDDGERFAIGEVGLPYYTRTEKEEADIALDEAPYLQLLEKFIKLSSELDLPIVLHAVYEDADKACKLLAKHGVRRAHFHWFKGSERTIAHMIEAGYCISITPDIAYEEEIRELVARYPIQLMMVETDGPWLFEGPYSGRPTEPGMTHDVVQHIAQMKGMAVEEVAYQLLQNTKTFYQI